MGGPIEKKRGFFLVMKHKTWHMGFLHTESLFVIKNAIKYCVSYIFSVQDFKKQCIQCRKVFQNRILLRNFKCIPSAGEISNAREASKRGGGNPQKEQRSMFCVFARF